MMMLMLMMIDGNGNDDDCGESDSGDTDGDDGDDNYNEMKTTMILLIIDFSCQAHEIIENLRTAFIENARQVDWMDNATKKAAINKVHYSIDT